MALLLRISTPYVRRMQRRCGRIPTRSAPITTIYLWSFARECDDVVCAWGSNAKPERAARVASIMRGARAASGVSARRKTARRAIHCVCAPINR